MAEPDVRADATPGNPVPIERSEQARKQRDRLATAVEVANWLRQGGTTRHGCGQSLWLQVRSDTASWLLRYRHAGRSKSLGLGACDPTGKRGLKLAEARAKADAALTLLRQGVDPAAINKAGTAGRSEGRCDCCCYPAAESGPVPRRVTRLH
jgi:Arm DNA-binding domain